MKTLLCHNITTVALRVNEKWDLGDCINIHLHTYIYVHVKTKRDVNVIP